MRAAFLADIHANISSLDKVLRFLRREKINKIYCLGDIIGYGKYPNEVIAALKRDRAISLLGNHERIFLSGFYPKKFNLDYTRRVLNGDCLRYIKSLPVYIILKEYKAHLSHDFPAGSDNYLYANSDFSIFDRARHKLIFLAHTHYPMFFAYFNKKIINPGSVGQPRDGNSKASFLLCDLRKEKFEFIRI
jgi:predicted phosphodiesterase